AHHDAVERFELHQELVDLGHLPAVARRASVAEQAIRLVEKEERVAASRLVERPRNALLGLADPAAEQIRHLEMLEVATQLIGEVTGPGGLPGAGWAVDQHAAAPTVAQPVEEPCD